MINFTGNALVTFPIILFQGRFQVSAELKDKEINNLKEELKSLQVLCFKINKINVCVFIILFIALADVGEFGKSRSW